MTPLPLSPLLLIGVGGAGAAMTRGILRAYGPGIRTLILDTDAATNSGDLAFVLLGGNRLNGRGTGGEPSNARASFQDNPSLIDHLLDGVRTAVVVTALGGGTGGGATGELLKHLHLLGIVTLVFATLPFNFEGEARMRLARTSVGSVCQNADVAVQIPLDQLVAAAETDNMADALSRGVDMVASGVTLLWRLLEKPGYIHLDAERLRNILSGCGRARFATATAAGANRVNEILARLADHPLLKQDESRPPVRTMLVGVLAGDDLLLSEVASVASGLSAAFGPHATLELGTVNDEATFSGRLSIVTLLFEESATPTAAKPATGERGKQHQMLTSSRFRNAEKTFWHDEDLDVPTYSRRQLTLDR